LLQACNDDIDVALYLVKQACRCIAGLKFVELLILWGVKRSGKDTFVTALLDIMNVGATENAAQWNMIGPAHYFTASTPRFDSEQHAAVTHEFDQLRLIVIPEVPSTAASNIGNHTLKKSAIHAWSYRIFQCVSATP
jgi:hypothetical protein